MLFLGGLLASCAPLDDEDPTSFGARHNLDFVLDRPDQLVQLARLDVIEGSLILKTTAELDVIELPNLRRVTGNLVVEGLSQREVPLRIELSGLLEMGGGIRVGGNGMPVIVDAPRLGRIDFLRLSEGQVGVELDGLLVVRGAITVSDAEIDRLDLPAVTSIEGGLHLRRTLGTDPEGLRAIGVDLPVLTRLGGGLEIRSVTSAELSAPALERVGGHVDVDRASVRIALDSVRTIDGDLRFRETNFDLLAPSLETLRGHLVASEGVFEGPPRADRLRSWRFPSLNVIEGSIEIDRIERLEGIEIPALGTLNGDIRVFGAPDLIRVDLRGLGRAQSDVVLEDLVDVALRMDVCERIDGPLRIRRTRKLIVELGRLRSVGQGIEIDTVELERLELGALDAVGRSFVLRRWSTTSPIELEALRQVGETLNLSDGAGWMLMDLPILERVGGQGFGDLILARNAGLGELRFPRLVEVGGTLEVADNPDLTPTRARASFEGVRASRLIICGNGGAEPCPR